MQVAEQIVVEVAAALHEWTKKNSDFSMTRLICLTKSMKH